jgi:hypothetical protein
MDGPLALARIGGHDEPDIAGRRLPPMAHRDIAEAIHARRGDADASDGYQFLSKMSVICFLKAGFFIFF